MEICKMCGAETISNALHMFTCPKLVEAVDEYEAAEKAAGKKSPRYPCSDGVDRDEAIDEFIELEKDVARMESEYRELEWKIKMARRRLSDISFRKLGLVGRCAADEEKKRRLSIPVVT